MKYLLVIHMFMMCTLSWVLGAILSLYSFHPKVEVRFNQRHRNISVNLKCWY